MRSADSASALEYASLPGLPLTFQAFEIKIRINFISIAPA
jgi:hypothetical protein